jgi:hypothetical protein
MNRKVKSRMTLSSAPRGIDLGRLRLTHSATIQRVKVKAVNTVVTIPTASVTAKPRTGPVPR